MPLEDETVTLRAGDVEAILTACADLRGGDTGTGDLGDRMQRVHLALHSDRVPAGTAPELAAAMAETRIYRDLLAEVLRQFEDPQHSGWWHARVRESVLRKWHERAGISRLVKQRREGAAG